MWEVIIVFADCSVHFTADDCWASLDIGSALVSTHFATPRGPANTVLLAAYNTELSHCSFSLLLEKTLLTFSTVLSFCYLPGHYFFSLYDSTSPSRTGPSHYRGPTVTLRHATLGITPVIQWLGGSRDLYVTTHNTYKRQISMPRRDSNPHSQQANGRRPTS